jgi:hypothetical protein
MVVRVYIACILFILYLALPIGASAAVLHIEPGAPVYYGDTIDCASIIGFNQTIAWWQKNRDPSLEQPDRVIEITNPFSFHIDATMEPGEWYQWEGFIERKAVAAFVVMNANRPYQAPTPTPIPVKLNTSIAPILQQPQPKALADILHARFEPLIIYTDEPCQVWLFGSDTMLLGARSLGTQYTMKEFTYPAGRYAMFLQYPDANGVYEIYGSGREINSTVKDVPSIDTAAFAPSIVQDTFIRMINDTAHFHGRVKRLSMMVMDQMVDINYLDETDAGSIAISGITTLNAGSKITVIFDEDRNVLQNDRKKNTFYTTATGDDIGAYRLWVAFMNVNIQNLNSGEHWISVYTDHGDKAGVPFRVYDRFASDTLPKAHIKYINYSYFIPTPTPEIITKIVQRVVTVTVPVPVAPSYEVVLQAQEEAARSQRQVLETNILLGILSVVLIYVGYRTGRYLVGVVKRARVT